MRLEQKRLYLAKDIRKNYLHTKYVYVCLEFNTKKIYISQYPPEYNLNGTDGILKYAKIDNIGRIRLPGYVIYALKLNSIDDIGYKVKKKTSNIKVIKDYKIYIRRAS